MVKIHGATPILRMFDEDKAREFYVGYLGFTVKWEHRFDDNAPLYMEIARDGCILHLSEHHGDCSPGAAVRIETREIDVLHREMAAKDYRYARPGCEVTPWNTREVAVTDPFGNRLIFYQDIPADTS